MNSEKTYSPVSGYVMLVIVILLFAFGIWGLIAMRNIWFVWPLVISVVLMRRRLKILSDGM